MNSLNDNPFCMFILRNVMLIDPEIISKSEVAIFYKMLGMNIPTLEMIRNPSCDPKYIFTGFFVPSENPDMVIKYVEVDYFKCLKAINSKEHLSDDEKYTIKQQVLFPRYKDYLRYFESSFRRNIEQFRFNRRDFYYFLKNAKKNIYYLTEKDIIKELEYFIDKNTPDKIGYIRLLLSSHLIGMKKIVTTFFPVFISEKYFRHHSYIIGGSGSGKTTFLEHLCYSIIQNRGFGLIVLDGHGGLAQKLARLEIFRKPEYREKLVYFDAGLDNECLPAINPFEITNKSEERMDTHTDELVQSFSQMFKGNLSGKMEMILAPTINTLIRRESSTLYDLYRFMSESNNSDLIGLGMRSPNIMHKTFFEEEYSKKSNDMTKQALRNRLQRALNSNYFRQMMARTSTVNLETAIKQKKYIIINLGNKLSKENTATIGKLLISMIYSLIKGRNVNRTSELIPTILLIDEFQQYLGESGDNDLSEMLEEIRKFSLSLILSHQLIHQLDTRLRHSILSNSSLRFVGLNENESTKKLASEIGTDWKELQDLKVGEFFMKGTGSAPIKIHAPDLFIKNPDKYFLSWKEWKEIKEDQIKRYYKSVKLDKESEANVGVKSFNTDEFQSDSNFLNSDLSKFRPKYGSFVESKEDLNG